MTACQDCDNEIRFVFLGYDDECKKMWSPPMESVTREVKKKQVKGFEQPDLVVIERFTPHHCPERQHRLDQEMLARQERQARARTTDEAWTEALKRICPKCHAVDGKRCLNLTDVRLGYPENEVRETRHPHAERLPFGWYDERTP